MYLAEEQTVVIGGRRCCVRLAKTDRPAFFFVEVDDKRYGVELIGEFDKDASSFALKVDGKQYKIKLGENKKRETVIWVNSRSFTIKQEKPRKPVTKVEPVLTLPVKETALKLPLEKGAIIASMPGKVVAIKVKKGDKVKAGDVLCILEAMKMENEIITHKDGIVKEIHVSKGSGVNKGEALFIVEPLKD